MTPSYAISENVTWGYSHFGSKWSIWGKRSGIFLRHEQNICVLREIYLTCELERLRNNEDNCTVHLKVYSMATHLLCLVILFYFGCFLVVSGLIWILYSISLSLWVKVLCYSVKTICNISVSESNPGHGLFSHRRSLHGLFLSTNGCRNLYESEKWVHWISQWY